MGGGELQCWRGGVCIRHPELDVFMTEGHSSRHGAARRFHQGGERRRVQLRSPWPQQGCSEGPCALPLTQWLGSMMHTALPPRFPPVSPGPPSVTSCLRPRAEPLSLSTDPQGGGRAHRGPLEMTTAEGPVASGPHDRLPRESRALNTQRGHVPPSAT